MAEAAKVLNISEGGVRYLIRAGRLPARRRKQGWVWEITPASLGRIRYGKRGRRKASGK